MKNRISIYKICLPKFPEIAMGDNGGEAKFK